MNTKRWMIAVLLCLAWIGTNGCLRSEATPTSGPPPDTLFTEELLQFQVVSADDKVIGPVDGLEVGTESGETAYVVVRLEDKYDFGKGSAGPQDRFILVPWSRLTPDMAQRKLIADVDAAVLAEAPNCFELPDTTTPAWDAENQRFWAEQ